jgi:hypothetical protein
MIDRALVVAGPIADVEAFEALVSEQRSQARRPLIRRGAVTPGRWRSKPALSSLRPLLRLLDRLPRRELRSTLPRIRRSHLESRTETVDGRLRLEYRFAAAGSLAVIRRLCRDVAAERPSLSFVIAAANSNGSDARSFLMSATGGEHYRLAPERRQIHVRRANREWAHISPRIASAEAAHAMLRETAARWDLRLAGVSSGKRPYRPAVDDSDWVFFKDVTKRRLVAVGPSAEIEWLIARARGDFRPPSRPGSPWRKRADLSFRALGQLLPRDVRPLDVPPELEHSWLQDIQSNGTLLRVRWGLDDDAWDSDEPFKRLLSELSNRYRETCLVECWEDPDALEAGGTLYWRGRAFRHVVSDTDQRRIMKEVYAQYGMTPDVGGDDEATADDEVDAALLERAETHWDSRVLRLFHRETP